jgi:GNAT superfamily N-acetyltransferase
VSVEQVASVHYRRQAVLARRAAAAVERLWREVDRRNIAASWRELLAQALVVVSSSQGIAAASSGIYVGDVLDELGLADIAAGHIQSQAFAGIASDGRPLDGLLYRPAVKALRQIGAGASVNRAMAAGLLDLDMIVRTQIGDAGRVADGVAITARPEVGGYVRMVVGKTCARCLILAGKRYRWNQGFQRHPRCDCRHIPVAEDVPDDIRTDPSAAFRAMSREEQDRAFGKAGAEAIREGADMARVVNARRGMYVAGDRTFTTEAATRRGIGRSTRLMPEQIYREAGNDRSEAIRLLRLHGYIT